MAAEAAGGTILLSHNYPPVQIGTTVQTQTPKFVGPALFGQPCTV